MIYATSGIYNVNYRSNTIKTYRSLYNKWLLPFNKEIPLGRWDIKYMEQFANHLLHVEELKPRTVKAILKLQRDYIQVNSGKYININDIVKTVMKQQQQYPVKALNVSQAKYLISILEKGKNERLTFLCKIALNTGMRLGEVQGLIWEDIDLIRDEITVQRSYKGPTKNGKSRIIPINSSLKLELLAKKPKNSNNGNKLFSKFNPNPALKRACKAAGVPEITFHGLRHTFATAALEKGRSVKEVAYVLGHSSTQTTMDIYWNLLNKMDMEIF